MVWVSGRRERDKLKRADQRERGEHELKDAKDDGGDFSDSEGWFFQDAFEAKVSCVAVSRE